MIRTHVSCVIEAPIQKVWRTIRPFDSLAAWHPHITACMIEGGQTADKVGSIRRLTLRDGGIVRETLLTLSDPEHRITYDIIESPMPVRNYVASLALHPVTEGDKTFAMWTVEFDTPDDRREEMIATLQDIFRSGLLNLNALT